MADHDSVEKDSRDGAGPAQAGGAGGGSDHGRKAITALVAVVALAGFGALVLYSYDRGTAPGTGEDAPLITAAKGPTKVRPKEPGGMEVPDRDMQVFSRINPNENPPRIEQLLPPPETVVAPPPPVAEAGPPDELDEKTRRALATAPAAGPGPVEDLMAPPPPPSPARATVAKPAPAKAKTQTKAAKTDTASVPPAPATPPAATAPVPPPAPKVASRGSGRVWRVQIAASRSVEAARKSWRRIKRKHGDVFGDLRLMLVKADLGKSKGVYYRMQVGPLADADAARKLCARIKQRKLGCFVVKP